MNSAELTVDADFLCFKTRDNSVILKEWRNSFKRLASILKHFHRNLRNSPIYFVKMWKLVHSSSSFLFSGYFSSVRPQWESQCHYNWLKKESFPPMMNSTCQNQPHLSLFLISTDSWNLKFPFSAKSLNFPLCFLGSSSFDQSSLMFSFNFDYFGFPLKWFAFFLISPRRLSNWMIPNDQ